MKKRDTSQIGKKMKTFLEKNPKIREALETFDISHSQYEKALESGICFYDASSTQVKSGIIPSPQSK
jgi:hypothetical protein